MYAQHVVAVNLVAYNILLLGSIFLHEQRTFDGVVVVKEPS